MMSSSSFICSCFICLFVLFSTICCVLLPFEPVHNKTCVTSEDSNQPEHPPSMARTLFNPSLDSPKAVEGTCDQRRL